MITANVFKRVFQVRYKGSMGTAFAVDSEDRQYLVTAEHVVKGVRKQDRLEIFHENKWKSLDVKLVGLANGDIDVAVLAPNIQIAPCLPLPMTAEGLTLGQDVFFLGFPYGLRTEVGALNRDFPLPLIRKGIFAGQRLARDGPEILLIDGHNNPGFSGGPVVFSPPTRPAEPGFRVASVIAGFHFEWEPIYSDDGKMPFQFQVNTGIVISFGIRYACERIQANPIGPAVK